MARGGPQAQVTPLSTSMHSQPPNFREYSTDLTTATDHTCLGLPSGCGQLNHGVAGRSCLWPMPSKTPGFRHGLEHQISDLIANSRSTWSSVPPGILKPGLATLESLPRKPVAVSVPSTKLGRTSPETDSNSCRLERLRRVGRLLPDSMQSDPDRVQSRALSNRPSI
jgi:hypothetical protein